MGARVCLTYDGSTWNHLEVVVPSLVASGFRGTFYAEPIHLLERIPDWRQVAAAGHEVGNGCLIGSALPDGSLPAWGHATVREEVAETRLLLQEALGDRPHSFAMPLGADLCRDGAYLAVVQSLYSVVRVGQTGFNADPASGVLMSLPMAGLSADQMREVVRGAIQTESAAVLVFGGVGTGRHAVDRRDHDDLLAFLAENADLIEVTTVTELVATEQARLRPRTVPSPTLE